VNSPVTFNPRIDLPKPKTKKTKYRIIRHQYTDQIEGIEAVE
jgi:hypothetical protein